jgi:hypothetical protein
VELILGFILEEWTGRSGIIFVLVIHHHGCERHCFFFVE